MLNRDELQILLSISCSIHQLDLQIFDNAKAV